MSDLDDVNPPESLVGVPYIKLPTRFFWGKKDPVNLWEEMRIFVMTRQPQVLYMQEFQTQQHCFFFATRELYVKFCEAFPSVLEGDRDES